MSRTTVTPELIAAARTAETAACFEAHRRILELLVRSFQRFAETELWYNIEEAFWEERRCGTLTFAPARPLGGPLAIEWHGLLSYSLDDDCFQADVAMFLFAQGQRLKAPGAEGDLLYIRYNPDGADPARQWSVKGWHQDEYDEWLDVEPVARGNE